MKRRFFWSIFGTSTVMFLLLAVTAVGVFNTARQRATVAELERAAEVVADLAVNRLDDRALLSALLQGDASGAFADELAAVRRAAGGSDLVFAAITPTGEILGRPAVRQLGLDIPKLTSGDTQVIEKGAAGGQLVAVAEPIAVEAPRNVTVVAVLSREAPIAIEVPRRLVGSGLILGAVVAAVLARLLAGGLARRMRSVAEAAEALSAGNLSARAEVGGTDEVHTVAVAFNAMAEQLEASRDRERQFLLAVGHDLRTPLTTITGYAEALEDGLDDATEVRRIAGVLSVESGRLRRLIEDVMLLARVESADFTYRPEPVDVTAHVGGLLEPYRDRATQVRVGFDADLAVTGSRQVDPDRIGQIIGNLCDNALRYTPETGSVRVSLSASADAIEIQVTDTGPGIEPSDLEHVFDRFYVARRYRGVRPEGSGLGLSIVRKLAEAMGGSVSADSEVGEGTSVTVVLPAPLAA